MKVYLVSILFTVLVGFSFIFAKMGVSESSPLILATYRFNIAALTILIAIAIGLVKINLKGKNIKKVISVAIYYGGFIVLQAIGFLYATSIESGIIFATIPIITMIIASFMLKEYTNIIQKIFVVMSVSGVVTMIVMTANNTSGDGTTNLIGVLIILLSSVSLSISNIITRKIRAEFTPSEISFMIVTICFVLLNIIFIGVSIKNGTLINYFDPLFNKKFLIAAIYLGVTCTFLTSLLISYMLAHMEAYKATLFGNVSTAIAIIAGVLIAKEPFFTYHFIGTSLIIVGVIGTTLYSKKKTKESVRGIE
jgi:drug/metabolite transporter (DMT)-like permease